MVEKYKQKNVAQYESALNDHKFSIKNIFVTYSLFVLEITRIFNRIFNTLSHTFQLKISQPNAPKYCNI